MSDVWCIVRKDLDVLRRDGFAPVILVVIPLAVILFIKPAIGVVLRAEGYRHASGLEQTLPGAVVMFAFFAMVYGADGVFREHRWNTWNRLRAAPVRPVALISGKALTPLLIILAQEAVLFGLGGLIFHLRVAGSVPAIATVAIAYAASVAGLSELVVAYSRTYQQAVAIGNLCAIILGGLGGALTPIQTLPGWAQAISNVTPSFWAMNGFHDVILGRGNIVTVMPSIVILLAMALLFTSVGVLRFRMDEVKVVRAL
jgi:ABC-2 type transport system permease protein